MTFSLLYRIFFKLFIYRSLRTIRESEEQNHLRDIEKILQKDKRYLLLDVIPEERSKILMDYVIKLDKEGTPPPPTASVDKRKGQPPPPASLDKRKA